MTFPIDHNALATAIRDHLATCQRNHEAFRRQVPLVIFDPAESTLNCRVCDEVEDLHKPPSEGGHIDTYICHLLKQQVAFYEAHFPTCAVTEGGVS